MICTRIITVSLLSICLSWTSTSWAQSGRLTKNPSSGTTLVERLASLRNSFLKDDSGREQASSSPSNRQSSTSRNSRSRSKSNNSKNNRTRSARKKNSSPAKTAKTILPKIQVGDLMPGGLFSSANRNKKNGSRRQPAVTQNPKTQNRGNLSRAEPQQAATEPRPLRIARSSPDLGTRRDELESALSELMGPQLNIEEDGPRFTPPQAESSEPIPGFLRGIPKNKETAPTPTNRTQKSSGPKTSKKTIPKKAVTKKKSIVQNHSLDLRRALLGGTVENELTAPVTRAATPENSESREPDLARRDNALRSAQDAFSESEVATNPTSDSLAASERANKLDDQEVVFDENSAESETLLFSYQQPAIVSYVKGPRKILVGREAKYRVVLQNKSDTAAHSLTTTIRIPAWAEVIDATSSRGIIQRADAAGGDGVDGNTLQWRVQKLEARRSQTLDLSLVPHSGRALQLGVSWNHAPVGSETMVEVQEPKLQISITGASDVLFGKPQRYQLSLSNPGTGVAEEVSIKLFPPGGDAGSETNQQIGSLQPRATKVVDLELTPREAGELQIKVIATGAGDLSADTIKHVFCRKPELEIDWRGPEKKYAGTVSTYYFRVRNPGTASTDPLAIKLQLPVGVNYVAASEGESFDAEKNSVSWQLAGLSPNEERFMKVRCRLEKPGTQTMQLSAQATGGDLRDAKTIETNVVALADLKLDISDPQGPIPVGDPATFEIRVRNRGTSTAQGVNIVALFSEGIDPISVEGAQYTIHDGRVSFRAIKSLPAGREVVLKIQAKATQPGMHIFRTEVVCQDLDIKLSAEETARFFKDEFRWSDGETPYSAERASRKDSASR